MANQNPISLREAASNVFKGGRGYYIWMALLLTCMALGVWAYVYQARHGLAETGMNDFVSWGFYISNFTFLVGVAAAAVLLVIPAYVYNFRPIKEIAFLGEGLAVSAIVMCILFVLVDLGQPLRGWHLLPVLGKPNFPMSMLMWDIIVLNGYLAINGTIFFYIVYRVSRGASYSKILWLILLSIPWAVGIHTVTAFLYNGLVARPFWNASILAPRFLASAFCSGPALMIIILQVVRTKFRVRIDDHAITKLAEIIAYTLGFNLFLFGAELFKEFYSQSVHLAPIKYLYFGLHGHNKLVPFMWTALIFNLSAFAIFIIPKTRANRITLNVGCVLMITAVYIEKGMGLIIPGFIPSATGEVFEYTPSIIEAGVGIGVWATGAFVYTVLLKFSLPVMLKGWKEDEDKPHKPRMRLSEPREAEAAADASA